MSEFAEKARSIGAPRRWGQTANKPVQNEENGRAAGYHVEHWDDRQDAVVFAETVRAPATPQEV